MIASEALPFLTFRLAQQYYALAIADVVEVVAMMQVDSLPDMPQAVLGVVNRHGAALMMLDLRLAFGVDAAPFDLDTLFIVGRHQQQMVGLVVDEVLQVRHFATDHRERMTVRDNFISHLITAPERLYQQVRVSSLIDHFFTHTIVNEQGQ